MWVECVSSSKEKKHPPDRRVINKKKGTVGQVSSRDPRGDPYYLISLLINWVEGGGSRDWNEKKKKNGVETDPEGKKRNKRNISL